MTDQDKIDRIADVLDQDSSALTTETMLDTIGWDSMGMLSIIALAKANGKTITGAQIRAFETVGDIIRAAF
jgi:acyl carrier protein